ncbi:Hypothetical protein OINT_1001201 [Brucella intermedia LMG 3301]|uniref:Uncharacterized protein n=1 Tax=Brucella intermedia LMG 3301 TaxID=641118 RepID=C4WJ05_9HYPH|nr:Hypothetical protein OINT_1001201 [Brucella intermedia LMG 3301]
MQLMFFIFNGFFETQLHRKLNPQSCSLVQSEAKLS